MPTAGDDVKNFARANLTKRLDWLNSNFGAGPFLTGANFTVADAYLFVILGWFGHVGLDVAKWPAAAGASSSALRRAPAVDRALREEGLK